MDLKNSKGAALVEMAIILPLLVLIAFGTCEFGWAMYVNNTLNNAAREGARRAAVTPSPINVDDHVKACLTFTYDESDLNIVTTTPTGTGDPVTVTVTLRFHTFTRMFPMLDGTLLQGEATMRYEL